jgi:hypothetical protein
MEGKGDFWLTVDVSVKRLDPLLLRNIQNGVLHHLERMVVEQNINLAHSLQRRVDSLLASVRGPQIRHVQVDFPAALLDHLLSEIGIFLLRLKVCDEDFGAFHGEEHGGGAADA